MMDILFEENEILLQQMQETFNKIEDAIYKDHYELSRMTDFSALSWKMFFTHPKIADWVTSEMTLIQQSKLRLLIKDIDANTKSTGLPQLINVLSGQLEDKDKKKDGPIFIYTYVPLNEQESEAPNVQTASKNLTITDITEV